MFGVDISIEDDNLFINGRLTPEPVLYTTVRKLKIPHILIDKTGKRTDMSDKRAPLVID